ncbi:MAG: hypothetical protein Ta2A_03340 [Treponemataceae bacterium]|nr:MAG: hypothetical protein Ta2A_03340 [Treponemataceae bacterium]
MRKKPLLFFALFLSACFAFCQSDDHVGEDYAAGPLYGKNLYIPYLVHYNFPSLPAKAGAKWDFSYHLSTYFVQDAHYIANKPSQSAEMRTYEKANVDRDYESIVGEWGFAFNPLQGLQLGMDMRLIAYYYGFGDAIVEGFHKTFHFPNGSRELFLQNQIYVNIKNDNGITFFLDKEAVTLGDIDLWSKWTFYETPKISLALLGAVKIPTGKLDSLSGSGYPDIAAGVLADIRALWWFSVYVQAGAVLPLEAKSYPMFNGLVGVEFHPVQLFSFNMQMNIKSPPVIGYGLSLPQTNLLVGFSFMHKGLKWQFFLEEDPFTNQGTDITFNLMFSHILHLNKGK